MLARVLDERSERGRRVLPSGIIEAKGCQRGSPVFEHSEQAACLDVFADIGLHEEAYASRLQHCDTRETGLVERHRPFHIDLDRLGSASVGKSLSMKRFTPRARGRASRIVKPFSRVRIVVREQQEA